MRKNPLARSVSGCVLLLFVAVAGCAPAPSDSWRLVLSHDENGSSLEGTKDALIAAVRSGRPIRLVVAGRRVEHAADAAFLTILGGEVFAQIDSIWAQSPASGPPRVEFHEAQPSWRAIYGTTGAVSSALEGAVPNEGRTAIRWFVQD